MLFLAPSLFQTTSFSVDTKQTNLIFISFFILIVKLSSMGLSNFPSPAEGVLPLIVMNTVMSVALVKNKLRSVLHIVGGGAADDYDYYGDDSDSSRERRVSITRYGSLCRDRCKCTPMARGGSSSSSGGDSPPAVECCVCLCRFEADEEVSELSCKHFFHRGCLDKWFDNQHVTCPLCRSIM